MSTMSAIEIIDTFKDWVNGGRGPGDGGARYILLSDINRQLDSFKIQILERALAVERKNGNAP